MNNPDKMAVDKVFNLIKSNSKFEKKEAKVPDCFCPICKSNKIEISETLEDDSGMTFFVFKCSDCGSRFILLEDLIDSYRRNIENAKIAEKHYTKALEHFMEIDL